MTALLGKLDLKYYSRDWDRALPSLSKDLMNKQTSTDKAIPSLFEGLVDKGMHIAGLALPFIGTLYQPAGHFISYTSTALNSGASVYKIFSETSKKEHIWNLVKNGVEVAGTYADLKIGLALHTVMNLGEEIYSLRDFNILSWSQVGEKMIPVVSNSLYLVSLYTFSKKMSYAVMGISLAFKSFVSAYKTYKSSSQSTGLEDMKTLDAVAHAAMTVMFFAKARTCYQQFMRIHNAVQTVFVVMRPASKSEKNPPNKGGLTQKGEELIEKIRPAMKKIREEAGKGSLIVFSSPAGHHIATGDGILGNPTEAELAEMDEDDQEDAIEDSEPVNILEGLRKPTKLGWELENKKARRVDPGYVQFHGLPPEVQWITPPNPQDPRSESSAQVAARLKSAIVEKLDSVSDDQLPVFITDGTAMQKLLKDVIKSNPKMDPKLAESIKDGAIGVITAETDENGNQKFVGLKRIDPKKAQI